MYWQSDSVIGKNVNLPSLPVCERALPFTQIHLKQTYEVDILGWLVSDRITTGLNKTRIAEKAGIGMILDVETWYY